MAQNPTRRDDPYVYEPVESSEIRLILLAPGRHNDDIHCVIHKARIQSKPLYDALSYAWGDNEKSHALFISDQKLQITRNLDIALRSIRSAEVTNILWVDAVCINQENIPERNSQVSIMREIYSTALRVLIWLGEEEEEDNVSLTMIQRFSESNTFNQSMTFENGTSSVIRLLRPFYVDEVPDTVQKDWSAICRLLQRPWFSRIWTIQEAVVASTSLFLCGKHSFPWEDFARTIKYLDESNLALLLGGTPIGVTILKLIGDLKMRPTVARPQLLLLDLFNKTMSNYVSDPRDRVFALVGLAEWVIYPSSSHTTSGSNYSNIEIDYSRSCEYVYTKAAIYGLVETRTTNYLSFAGVWNYASSLNLPSWVPDWGSNHDEFNFAVKLSALGYFRSTGDMQPNISVSDDEKVLFIEGLVIDSIKQIGTKKRRARFTADYPISKELRKREFQEIIDLLDDCDRVATRDHTTVNLPEDYWRMLVCDLSHSGSPALLGSERLGLQGYQMLRKFLPKYPSYIENEIANDEFLTAITSEPFQRYLMALNTWSKGRFMCKTEGDYLGWGPVGADIGDKICLIKGANVPYVLRTSGQNFILKGEAYLYGIMHGEAIGKEDLEWRTFSLV